MPSTLDIVILMTFLLLNLGVGLWYARGVKTLRGYAVGNKNFSTWIITLTILATWMSGSYFTSINDAYEEGFSELIYMLSRGLALAFVGYFMIPRMQAFLQHLSMAETIGSLYGKGIRLLTALAGIATCITAVAMQFKACGNFFHQLLGWDQRYATLLVAGIVLFYATLGGIRAVTFTDMVQFIVFTLFMGILLLVTWQQVPDTAVVTKIWDTPPFSMKAFLGNYKPMIGLLGGTMLFTVLIQSTYPAGTQRVQMARDVYQARKSFLYAALLWGVIAVILFSITLLIKTTHPYLDEGKALNQLLNQTSFPGFKGLCAAGLLALSMSTADSWLNTATVLFANDIATPFGVGKRNPMRLVRWATLAMGGLSVIPSLFNFSLREISRFGNNLFHPPITPIFLLTVFGFRTSKRVAWTGMLTGLVTTMVFKHTDALEKAPFWANFDILFPHNKVGILANFGVTLLLHYLLGEPGGWVGVQQPEPLQQARLLRAAYSRRRRQWWQGFSLHRFLAQQQPRSLGQYTFLGVYSLLTILLGSFSLQRSFIGNHMTLFYPVLICGLLATAFLLTYPAWPPFMQRPVVALFGYPLALGSTLFFMPGLLLLCSDGKAGTLYMLCFANVLEGLMLFSWPLALALISVGWGMATLLYRYFMGGFPHVLPTFIAANHTTYIDWIAISLAVVITYYALRRHWYYHQREQRLVTSIQESQRTSQRYAYKHGSFHAKIQQIYNEHQLIYKEGTAALQKEIALWQKEKNDSQLQKLSQQFSAGQATTHQTMDYVIGQLFTQYDQLNLNTFLVQFEAYYQQLPAMPPLISRNRVTESQVVWHSDRLIDLLAREIQHMVTDRHRVVTLSTIPTTLDYPTSKRQVKAVAIVLQQGLEKHPLATIQERYIYQESAKYMHNDESMRTLYAHYGFIQRAEGAVLMVLPQSLAQIRPTHAQDSHTLPTTPPSEAILRHAKETEIRFWDNVFTQLPADQQGVFTKIEQAVTLMKQYHGITQRKSGQLYYTHTLEVSMKTMAYSQNPSVWIAALLHDVIEDSHCSPAEIEFIFGPYIKELVLSVSALNFSQKKYKLANKEEQAQKILQGANRDTQLIKLCDRMHNLETLQAMPQAKQKIKIDETIRYFIPLAKKIGEKEIVEKLTELCKP